MFLFLFNVVVLYKLTIHDHAISEPVHVYCIPKLLFRMYNLMMLGQRETKSIIFCISVMLYLVIMMFLSFALSSLVFSYRSLSTMFLTWATLDMIVFSTLSVVYLFDTCVDNAKQNPNEQTGTMLGHCDNWFHSVDTEDTEESQCCLLKCFFGCVGHFAKLACGRFSECLRICRSNNIAKSVQKQVSRTKTLLSSQKDNKKIDVEQQQEQHKNNQQDHQEAELLPGVGH